MSQNSQKYRNNFSKKWKNSLWSLLAAIIGLIFTILALTNDPIKLKKDINNSNKTMELENRSDREYISISIEETKDGPTK